MARSFLLVVDCISGSKTSASSFSFLFVGPITFGFRQTPLVTSFSLLPPSLPIPSRRQRTPRAQAPRLTWTIGRRTPSIGRGAGYDGSRLAEHLDGGSAPQVHLLRDAAAAPGRQSARNRRRRRSARTGPMGLTWPAGPDGPVLPKQRTGSRGRLGNCEAMSSSSLRLTVWIHRLCAGGTNQFFNRVPQCKW